MYALNDYINHCQVEKGQYLCFLLTLNSLESELSLHLSIPIY